MPPSPAGIFRQHQRQVHLDFHTSPWIPDVASEFDAAVFADEFARAHVNSVTVFARCHHGMCYYPAAHGTPHPALVAGRDLLGEQIEALHRRGIRAPIYTSVAWDEDAAARHPEWRQQRGDGTFANAGVKPGEWKFLDFLEPGFQDFLESHVRELLARYGTEVDGLFFDIVSFHPEAGWGAAARRLREVHGLTSAGREAQTRFQSAALESFAGRFTPLIRDLAPAATVFYNAGHRLTSDGRTGARAALPAMTHFELESLPSGPWGYHHFPRVAHAIAHWGVPWLGMTGRFQRSWGDFGGIKPQAALEYECFRTQALGGANSIGDQLPPRGRLEPDVYLLIGEVYSQCAAAEPFYNGSVGAPQFANFLAGHPARPAGEAQHSDEGAMLMATDLHRDVAMIDEHDDLSGYDVVQLPDSVVVGEALAARLRDYYLAGGKLLLSCRAGFDLQGRWMLDFLPLSFDQFAARTVPKFPTYWRATEECAATLGHADRVCYLPGVMVTAGTGTRVLINRALPYFQRTDATFSSHAQTPPLPAPDPSPALVVGERFAYFADPIFREYRETGNLLMRDGWHEAMNYLENRVCFGSGLPTTVHVFPRKRGDDLLLTLLHYIPTRKAADLDTIEERSSFAGETLSFLRPEKLRHAPRIFRGPALEQVGSGAYALPAAKGRLLVEVSGYFA